MELNLKRVRYFLGLARTLNFSQTARDFGISQPALTKAIGLFEEEVGGLLIRREGRHTHLTQLANSLLEYFEGFDASARRAENATRVLVQGENPTLRLGVMCTVGPGPISEFLAGYQLQNSSIGFEIRDYTRAELPDALLDGAIDVAITGASVKDETRIKYVPLYNEPMVVACAESDPLAKRSSVGLKDVATRPYLDRIQCEFRHIFLTEAQRLGFDPKLFTQSDNEDWVQHLIRQGAGVAIVPDKWVTHPGIKKLRLTDPKVVRTVAAATALGRMDNPGTLPFIDAIKKHEWT
ncbi:MAG: LysR family transcriptional regulator [Hyphomicrobiaceae bacterium]